MKRFFLILIAVVQLSGCALEEMRHEGRSDAGRAFSVEQAKEFFETDYADMLTRSQGDDTRAGRFRGRMYPGDFTPLWEKAEYSESDGVAAYDVDILADRKVIAIRSKFGAGGAKAERLNVYQKLVVRRDVESGKMAAYVMSLIPDIGGDDRRIPERFRSRGKDKKGFSGIVVYATTDRGALVRVQEYKDGVLKRGVYIPSGKGSYIDRCVKAREILNGIALISKQCIRTKAGEDNWGDDYEDWYHPIEEDEWWVGNFTEIGYGVYTDGNGHYYIDNDGDGLIDEETIAPGYIEDEEPEDPWTEDNGSGNENGGENGNGGDDGDNENEGNNEGGETGGDDDWTHTDGNEPIDEEMVALGREGLRKIEADLESGNVKIYQELNGVFVGFGLGANTNGIILSATNFVKEMASDITLQAFGRSISAVGIVCGAVQTFIAITNDEEFTTGDYLNLISTALGAVALIPTPFPIINGALGVTSGIIGIVSACFSYNIQSGIYIIETSNGGILYIYINNSISA